MVHYGQMSQFGLICPKDSVPEVLLKYIFANLRRAAMFFLWRRCFHLATLPYLFSLFLLS